MQHRDDFTDRIDGHPEPEYLVIAAEPGAQFIELDVRQVAACRHWLLPARPEPTDRRNAAEALLPSTH